MPRGRLAPEDRQRLAAGLAEGLGFAGIARRLGRPTSTITREVARNGGREGYRWEVAQQATRRRARRHRPARARDVPRARSRYGRDAAAVDGFMERFATTLARTGLPKMTARVLIALFTSDSRVLTAAELVLRLRVSPASISKAIGHLEELELVRREHDEHSRRERYAVDDGVWPRAWSASARKQVSLADVAREGVKILGPATPAGARLREMERFFAQLSGDMAGASHPPLAAAEDLARMVAALVHAARPVPVKELARVLGWSVRRADTVLREAAARPAWTDPLAVTKTASGYVVAASPGRLSRVQRLRLEQHKVRIKLVR